jgi:putative chitinase
MKLPKEWEEIIRQAAPNGKTWIIQGLADAMPAIERDYEISTVDRQAHFLAQLIHESDGLQTTEEYATGSAYEGRKDLGNVTKGDGRKYKGRGLIQLTGRANYRDAGTALHQDFIASPDVVKRFPAAAMVSAWFWHTHKLNQHADADDIRKVTKVINGGLTHLDRRIAAHKAVKKALV